MCRNRSKLQIQGFNFKNQIHFWISKKITVLKGSIKGLNIIQNLSHLLTVQFFFLGQNGTFWNGYYLHIFSCKSKANSLERVPTAIHNGYHRCQIWSSTSVLKPTRLRPRLVLREYPPIRANLLTKVLIKYYFNITLLFVNNVIGLQMTPCNFKTQSWSKIWTKQTNNHFHGYNI